MATVDDLLRTLPAPNVLLDSTARDDAALYRVSDEIMLATSVDFGTPISSHPMPWGKIATLNALSDLYAMGATPKFALSMVGWPATLSQKIMLQLIDGAISALKAEATSLVGGHTITSRVPLFGLSVTGTVHPDKIMLISNARPGQTLILTKPLGTGVITAAQKSSVASPEAILKSEDVMLTSNRLAAELAVDVGIRAATDVTGYGLIGHLHNMLRASGHAADLIPHAIPIISDAVDLVTTHGIVPNSAERNYLTLDRHVEWFDTPLGVKFILCDPQTSGGLLLSADDAQADAFLTACEEVGQSANIVGKVVAGTPGSIRTTD